MYGRHIPGWDIHTKPKWALSFTQVKGGLGSVPGKAVWILLKIFSQ